MKLSFSFPDLRIPRAWIERFVIKANSASASTATHAILLSILFLMTFDIPRPQKIVRISAELPEQALLVPEFLEMEVSDSPEQAANAGLSVGTRSASSAAPSLAPEIGPSRPDPE